ncbi:hypothetical protein C0J52_15727, partial [Blattella germanica]
CLVSFLFLLDCIFHEETLLFQEVHASPSSLFFNDEERSVDFVLVWDSNKEQSVTESAKQQRKFFEMNLEHEGLELEYEEEEKNGLNFIKIHVPLDVLRRYSEFLKLRMPIRELIGKVERSKYPGGFLFKRLKFLTKKVQLDQTLFPPKPLYFTAIYSRDKDYLFDITSKDFFSPRIRARIVQYILERQRYSDDEKDVFAFGIGNLTENHGSFKVPGSMRYLLYTEWASLKKWYRLQPLDYIKEYFGAKIALYFAWLGFYTYMLILPSLVGIGCFLYGLSTFAFHEPWQDACGKMKNVLMCPICDTCDYWKLGKKCTYLAQMYIVDNPSTIIFASVMSLWAATFVELWKMYADEITYRWDLRGFDINEDNPRSKYLAQLKKVKKTKIHNVTKQEEPDLSFWRVRFIATIWTASFFLLLVT